MSRKRIVTSKLIDDLLNEPFWPETLICDTVYARTHDDCDGDLSQQLQVMIDQQGDVYIFPATYSLRFRTYGGGGMSLRVRNALVILAEAIRLDNEKRPQ